nr:myelin-associated glycoprotein-like isoform X3 [Taeniopygia guttata]
MEFFGGFCGFQDAQNGFWGFLGDFWLFLGVFGDPALRDCSLELGPPLSAELAGRYYFRADLGGYNQYSFSEHAVLQVLEEPVLEVPPDLVAREDFWGLWTPFLGRNWDFETFQTPFFGR